MYYLNLNLVLIFVIVYGVQNNYCQVELSLFEEECITSTAVNRNTVIQDKKLELDDQERQNKRPSEDSKFNDYLECYANKLAENGQLVFTKNVLIKIPGYKTKYEIKSLYCNEEDEKVPFRPCVQNY